MSFDPGTDIGITESPEQLLQVQMESERNELLSARDTDADLQALWDDLYPEWHQCTPEEKEHNAEQYIQRYAADLEHLLWPEVSLEIRKQYENTGDIEAAVFIVVSNMDSGLDWQRIQLQDVETAVEQIVEYLDPRITSQRIDSQLRSEDGIRVRSGMNASYVAALSGSHRSFSFNENANHLNVGDTLSYWADESTLMRNDTQIWEMMTPDEGLHETIGTEFMESRYAPIIQAHQDSSVDPLINISGEQVEAIWDLYSWGSDILEAMSGVLDSSHEALSMARNLDNPDTLETRRAEMYEDFWIEQDCRINPETGSGWDTITNLISENYTRLTLPNWETDKEASLILAVQISANKVVEGKFTFTRTQAFEEAFDRIKEWSESREQMYRDLQLIHQTVNNAEGIRGKSRQRENMRIRQRAEQKSLFLQAEFEAIQALFIQTNNETQEAITQEREARNQADENTSRWEVESLGWWSDIDTLMAELDAASSESV